MTDFFEIDFLEVGTKRSGDAIVARYRQAGTTTIHVTDGGYQDTGPVLAAHIRKYYNNPLYIDHVVVTHPDGDHASGICTILDEFTIGALWMLRPWQYANELIPRFSRFTSVENLKRRLHEIYPFISAVEERALKKGIPIFEPFQGTTIGAFSVLAPTKARYLDLVVESDKTPDSVAKANEDRLLALGGLAAEILRKSINLIRAGWGAETFPPEETSAENDMSVVQYARLCDNKILLTGDAGRGGLTEAADFGESIGLILPGIDRFQVPHHGSRRNVSSELLDRWLGEKLAKPLPEGEARFTAIVSASQDDPDHPRKAVVRALVHRGARVVSTDDGRGTKRTSYNAPEREGWTAAKPLPYPEDQEE